MPSVSAVQQLAAPLPTVEAAWYDARRWADWVVGLERVVEVQDGWPSRPGATVTWCSNPAGRGIVREQVLEYVAGEGQRLAVTDDLIEGEQSVTFALADGGVVEVSLSLTFRRRRGGLFTALVDQFFSRSAMADALARTLERFGAALRAETRQ